MKNRSLISRILSGCLFVLFLVAADQLSKYAALRLRSGDIVLIKGVLRLMYAENTGAAWSLFSGKSPLLIAVTSLLILYVVISRTTEEELREFPLGGKMVVFLRKIRVYR